MAIGLGRHGDMQATWRHAGDMATWRDLAGDMATWRDLAGDMTDRCGDMAGLGDMAT